MTEKKLSYQEMEKLEQKFYELTHDERINLFLFDLDFKHNRTLLSKDKELINYIFSKQFPCTKICKIRISDLRELTFNLMLQEDLVKTRNDQFRYPAYIPSIKGYRINENGGWLKHLNDLETDRKLNTEQVKSVIKSNTKQIYLALMTISIVTLSGLVDYLNYDINKSIYLNNENTNNLNNELMLYKSKYFDIINNINNIDADSNKNQ
jgi:hypothetical protein